MKSKPQGKQIRMTLEDTMRFQELLKEKIKILASTNSPLKYTERREFFEMVTKALLSQGCSEPVYFVQDGWFIFESCQTLAHRLADLHSDKVLLKTNRPKKIEIVIPISELWSFLYTKMLYLFPQACAEALHLSAEAVERPRQGTYRFTSKEDLSS